MQSNEREGDKFLLMPKYAIAQLLEQCDFTRPISEEEKEWLDMEPVRDEIL